MMGQLVRKREDNLLENDVFILKESFHRVSKRIQLLEHFIKTKFGNEFKSAEFGKRKTPFKPSAENFASILFKTPSAESQSARAGKVTKSIDKSPVNRSGDKCPPPSNIGSPALTRTGTGSSRSLRSASKHTDSQKTKPSEVERNDDSSQEDYEEDMDTSGHFNDQDNQMDDTNYLTPSSIISEPETSKKEIVKEQDENSGDEDFRESDHPPSSDSEQEDSEEEEYVPNDTPWAEEVRKRRAVQKPRTRTDWSSYKYPSDRKCTICFKTFKESKCYKKNFRFHMENHSKERSFKCEKCDRAYYDEKGLKYHMKLTHDQELHAKFKCQYCDRTFVVDSYRIKHEIIHTKDKPFACNECGRAYSQKKNLTIHIQLKHSSLTRQLLCSECGKCFLKPYQLKNHELVHQVTYDADGNKVRNIICPFCPATFYTEYNKEGHIRRIHGFKRKPKEKVSKGKKRSKSIAKPRRPKTKVDPDSETDQAILGLASETIERTVVPDNNNFL